MMNLPAATSVIIITTVIISYFGFRDDIFIDKYCFNIKSILGYKEFYRLITSGFLHANMGHLAFNMFSFYSFSQGIETIYGAHYVILIYSASLIGGNLFALLLKRNHPDYSALGASGAVSGIIFASIFLLPGGSIYIFLIPIALPAYIYGILFVLVSMYGIRTNRGNIGHEAHLGGSITGILILFALSPLSIWKNKFLFIVIISIFSGFLIPLILYPLLLTGQKISLKENKKSRKVISDKNE